MTAVGRDYWYKIYGLVVRSEFELPEASTPLEPHAAIESDAIVEIRRGHVPPSLPGAHKLADWVEAGKEGCIYDIDGICRILVSGGRSVIVEPVRGIPDRDMRVYLLGSALGTIVHQRGLVPFHISMLRTPFGNIAFTGPSGAGKSTMAAALEKYCGWRILCDDVSVFHPACETAVLHNGVRNNKLWSDAIAGLGLGHRQMSRDQTRHEKFHLELEYASEASTPLFRHLVELKWGESIIIRELSPANRFRLLMNSVYRPFIPAVLNSVKNIQDAALRLSPSIRAFVLERPRELADLESVAKMLSVHCAQSG